MRNITEERKSNFDQFQKAFKRLFSINYGEPLNNISKLKYLPNPWEITQFKNPNLLHVVCYEERANHREKFSMPQEVKNRPYAALIIESSQKKFLTYFQKPMWFYLLTPRDSLIVIVFGQSLRQTFLRCEMPWTALTEIAT